MRSWSMPQATDRGVEFTMRDCDRADSASETDPEAVEEEAKQTNGGKQDP